jgi:hypothetical protein
MGILLVILIADGGGAETQIDSCTTISSPGVYVLNRSINATTSPCINIISGDITFDGAGYSINGSGNAVAVRGVRDVVVENVNIVNPLNGISMEGTDRCC